MFTTPVGMECTEEQYIRDLKEPLLNMGYVESTWFDFNGNIVTNFASRDDLLGSPFEDLDDQVKHRNRYIINNYNPELFLALASMTDGEFKIGDWVVVISAEKRFQAHKEAIGHMFKIPSDTRLKRFLLGEPECIDPDNKYWINYRLCDIRKATKEEIINKLTKNEMKDSRFPFTLMMEDGKRIIDIACSIWKYKLAEAWGKDFILYGYASISEEFYKQMREACTDVQHKLLDEIFGKDKNPCPYVDGQLIMVKIHNTWNIRYATGKMRDGEVETYNNQAKSGDTEFWYKHTPLPEDFVLPD